VGEREMLNTNGRRFDMYKLQKQQYYWTYYYDKNGHKFGSDSLKRACWNQFVSWLRGAIDNPETDAEVIEWLNAIASEKVNNPKSKFYIYG
jgi:hypothetical protein